MVTRIERVVLELEDRFSRQTLQAAAAAKTLDGSLNDLGGTSTRTQRSVSGLEKPVANVDRGSRLADRSINQLTGRLAVLRDVAVTLGPALVPLGAGGAAAVAGLAAQFGALAGGIGVSILALQGVGNAVKALNDYQLEPTTENLTKLNAAMSKLGPDAAEFVVFLESISPQLRELQNVAAEGLLTGLTDGIEDFLSRGTQLNSIVARLSTAMGDLSASAGEALGGERFDAFFGYIDTEAGPLLMEFGRSVGYVAEALANLMVAFSPVSSDFSGGLEDMTRSFAEWSRGLQDNRGFQEFIDYVRTNGPAALDFLGSFIRAVSSVVEAAAPVGQAVLPVLTALLDVFAGIAGTPIGSTLLAVAAGFVAFNRAATVATPAAARLGKALFLTDAAFTATAGSSAAASAGMSGFSKAAGIVAIALGGFLIADKLQSNFDGLDTSVSQLTGNLLNLAAAQPGATLGSDFSDLADSLERLTDANAAQRFQTWVAEMSTIESFDSDEVNRAKEQFESLDAALSGLVLSGGPDAATQAFDALTDSLGLTDSQIDDLRGQLPDYADALQDAENQARLTGTGHEALSSDLDSATASLDQLRDRLKAARDELKESRQAARGVAESFVNLGDSLNDSEVSLSDWISELEDNAEALRQFEANAKRAARNGLDEGLVDSLRNAGSEGALRMRQLANASESEIDRANEAWRKGQGAVKDFVNEVGGVKPKYVTRLEAQVDQAMAELARLKAYLDIPDEYVNVFVTRRTATTSPGFGPVGSADGSTVPKTGRGYADRHLYLLADGEEVVSNRHGQADRHRSLLKAINANRLADGGTAGRGMSLDQRGEILALQQTIRGFIHDLRATGKDELHGLNRKIAINSLAQSRRDLRQLRNPSLPMTDIRDAIDLGPGMSKGDVRQEYAEFKRVLREAGIELPKNFDQLRDRAVDLADRFGKVTQKIESTEQSLDKWRERAETVSDAVRSMFDNNIYARGGLANTMLQLEADRNDTSERNTLLQGVSGLATLMGLNLQSGAFQSLATEADMQTLRDLDTAAELQAFFDAYAARTQAQTDAGAFAADVITGTQIEALESTLDQLKDTQDNIADKLDKLEERTERGASAGTREGAREGVKDGMRDRERVKSAKARTR